MCYIQNGTVPGGEGQVTWFKWDKLYIIGCEMTKRWWNWRGNLNIWSISLVKAITV